MTNVAQSFVAKALVVVVAAAMVFTAYAPSAKAQSMEDLQAQIAALMAQIAALQGGSSAGSSAAGVCPFTWTRDLRTGATGADVKALQQFLNADAETRVAATGAGSAGMETMTFGPATAAAVSKFQTKYRADILTPNGLVAPTGTFGPSTRAKANSLCVAPAMDDEDEDEMEDEDESEDEDMELSGEGTLDTFEIDDASDTDIQEGAEDEVIAELTMEAADGDIEINRMDLRLNNVDGSDDPWDTFEEISLWVDGEKIATFDASDEDEYLNENQGTFRFTGLELVLREDEEVEVLVGATVQNGVDDDLTNGNTWTVQVDEARYFDADGVAEDDDDLDGAAGDTVSFDIVEEGDGEELSFSLGDGNPDATDIVVDTDNKTNNVTVLEYTIEAEEGDIELNTLFVKLTTSATTSNVIDDVTLDIDGDTFDAENNATSGPFIAEFDIDGDVVVEDGEEVTVKVMVDFRAQEVSNNVARYPNGTTIKAEVTSAERDATDAEGADDVDTFSGSAVGETHTLVAEGIVVPVDGVTAEFDTQGQNDTTGIFSIDFEVTAVEGDFYVREFATLGATTTGVTFSLETPAGYSAGSSSVSGVLSSTADEDTSGVFTVREGETETFTLTVTVDPNVAGNYRVGLTGVYYTANTNGVAGSTLYTPTPAQDFRTDFENINN
jgi:hypothetical protein